MSVREYWIYQERDTPKPWTLYLVKDYNAKRIPHTFLDGTFYHEDIPNATQSHSFVDIYNTSIENYAAEIFRVMSQYVEITEQDRSQIVRELQRILL